MKTINLLPESEIKELKLELASKEFLSFFAVIFGSLVIFIVGAFCAKVLISSEISVNNSQIAQLQSQLNSSENKELQKEIIALNADMKNIQTIDRGRLYWSKVLVELGNLAPADMHLDIASFDRATGAISLKGTVDDRASVLIFWSSVRKSAMFKDIDFPLNNLEKPADTPFTFTFYLNPSAITNP